MSFIVNGFYAVQKIRLWVGTVVLRLLHQAALWDNAELLEDLLNGEELSFINSCDSWGRTPLHAASTTESSQCLRFSPNHSPFALPIRLQKKDSYPNFWSDPNLWSELTIRINLMRIRIQLFTCAYPYSIRHFTVSPDSDPSPHQKMLMCNHWSYRPFSALFWASTHPLVTSTALHGSIMSL